VAPPEDPTLFGNYCLIHERTDGWWRKIMAKAGVHPASSRNIYFHRTYLIADAAARGLGLAVGEDVICAERLKGGSLIRLPGPSLRGSRMFFLLEPAGQRSTSGVRRLRDWLMAEASAHKAWQKAFAAQWNPLESK
jgi:LysR family glycine cleavage system transcriptional activator